MLFILLHVCILNVLLSTVCLMGMHNPLPTVTVEAFVAAVRKKDGTYAEQIATTLLQMRERGMPSAPFSIDTFRWHYRTDDILGQRYTYEKIKSQEWVMSPYTPVHWAAERGYENCLHYLLKNLDEQARSEVLCQTKIEGGNDQISPLYYAVKTGQKSCIKLLLVDFGCDCTYRPAHMNDDYCRQLGILRECSPIELAVLQNHFDIAFYMLNCVLDKNKDVILLCFAPDNDGYVLTDLALQAGASVLRTYLPECKDPEVAQLIHNKLIQELGLHACGSTRNMALISVISVCVGAVIGCCAYAWITWNKQDKHQDDAPEQKDGAGDQV